LTQLESFVEVLGELLGKDSHEDEFSVEKADGSRVLGGGTANSLEKRQGGVEQGVIGAVDDAHGASAAFEQEPRIVQRSLRLLKPIANQHISSTGIHTGIPSALTA